MYIMPNELKIGYVITLVWLGDIRFLGFFLSIYSFERME